MKFERRFKKLESTLGAYSPKDQAELEELRQMFLSEAEDLDNAMRNRKTEHRRHMEWWLSRTSLAELRRVVELRRRAAEELTEEQRQLMLDLARGMPGS